MSVSSAGPEAAALRAGCAVRRAGAEGPGEDHHFTRGAGNTLPAPGKGLKTPARDASRRAIVFANPRYANSGDSNKGENSFGVVLMF